MPTLLVAATAVREGLVQLFPATAVTQQVERDVVCRIRRGFPGNAAAGGEAPPQMVERCTAVMSSQL